LTGKSNQHRSQPKPYRQDGTGEPIGHPWNYGEPWPGTARPTPHNPPACGQRLTTSAQSELGPASVTIKYPGRDN
jgi:hypothetical protein